MILNIEYKEGAEMEKRTQERFRQVLAIAAADMEYQTLQARCAELDGQVLAALEKLPEEDRAALREYIRALGESALRLTEIACAG